MSIWKKIIVFLMPVVFSAYPVLAIFSNNLQTLKFADITSILIAVVILGAGLTTLFLIIFRDISKASLIAICWLAIFFSYGQVYNVIHHSLGVNIGRNVILLPIAFGLMAFSLIWIGKLARDLSWLVTLFGSMTGILFIMVSYSLVRYYISTDNNKSVAQAPASITAQPGVSPNIYYIILDAHGRQDILQDLYGYDDSGFINFLKARGFFVADSSHSNYPRTVQSLSSSLNLQYLDTIGIPNVSNAAKWTWLAGKVKDSRVRAILEQQGYKFVSFNNDFQTSPADADIYYNFDTAANSADTKSVMAISEIDQMFLSSTMARVIVDLGLLSKIANNQQLDKFHYLQVKYIFTKLSETPSLPGKNFIFAHIIAPHPPFIFNPDGSFKPNPFPFALEDGPDFPGTPQEYINGYHDQVEYVDKAAENLITDILSRSTTPPIIIIQGDHGPGAYLDWSSVEKTNLDERMSILNAYYFPGIHSNLLYASITPVNSFRVLLSEYFGMNLPLLPDQSYFSTESKPYNFINVTAKLKK